MQDFQRLTCYCTIKGANIYARTSTGEIPAELAKENGHKNVCDLFAEKDPEIKTYITFMRDFKRNIALHKREGK
jgi:hypothetical protein